MKKTFLLALVTCFIFSCSEEEVDNNQSLEEATLSLSEEQQVVEVPTSLQESDDPMANQANIWVKTANNISAYTNYFDVPDNATKRDEPIVAANSRTNLTAEEYLVYEWSDPQYGGVAYQVSQDAEKVYFEIFVKYPDDPNWYKFMEAQEKKDRSAGSLSIFDVSAKTAEVSIKYEWTRSDGTFHFVIKHIDSSFEIDMVVNEETGAGELKYYSSGVLETHIIWDAQGSGSWTTYNNDGGVQDEGSWTA